MGEFTGRAIDVDKTGAKCGQETCSCTRKGEEEEEKQEEGKEVDVAINHINNSLAV